MALIEWSADLSVGINAIDAQHREWIRHYNDLIVALEQREGPARLGSLLGYLIDYTTQHFGAEKAVMVLYGYSELEQHAALHAELRNRLADLVRDYEEEGATHVLADATNDYLRAWLVEHIKTVDARLGDFLRQRGHDPVMD